MYVLSLGLEPKHSYGITNLSHTTQAEKGLGFLQASSADRASAFGTAVRAELSTVGSQAACLRAQGAQDVSTTPRVAAHHQDVSATPATRPDHCASLIAIKTTNHHQDNNSTPSRQLLSNHQDNNSNPSRQLLSNHHQDSNSNPSAQHPSYLSSKPLQESHDAPQTRQTGKVIMLDVSLWFNVLQVFLVCNDPPFGVL